MFGINCFNANIVNEAGENSSAARAMAYNVILENLTIQNSNFELLNKDSFKIIGCVRIDKNIKNSAKDFFKHK